MVLRLQKTRTERKGIKLLFEEKLFRIVFEVKLDNGFELKDMTREHIQEFHKFVHDTVYKGLTISEVDKLFLRKRGLGKSPVVISNGKELVHYGKDRNPFRIFGYYNSDSYFVICRIDGAHQTHQ